MIVERARLREKGLLSPLDDHFARALAGLVAGTPADVELAAALASRHVGQGHVCLDLPRLVAGAPPLADVEGAADDAAAAGEWPALDAWLGSLRDSPLVQALGPGEAALAPDSEVRPLVLDAAGRLYLRRYFDHQSRLAAWIRARAASRHDEVDAGVLDAGLERLFGPESADAPDRQRAAARMAVERPFCVISGGPGTGKTTTVAKILALLFELAAARGDAPPRVALVAPTGKAAAHLGRSIQSGVAALPLVGLAAEAIPAAATTIHRCLGSTRRSDRPFRHGADNPLEIDVLVVDEASMVDLALMQRLLEAVPAGARVILLGDRDQLASVEAGAVLGDICNVGDEPENEPGGGPLAGAVVQLTRSYRYRTDGGIGALARAINDGDADAALALLDAGGDGALALHEPPGGEALAAGFADAVVAGYRPMLEAADLDERLARFGDFRVLAAHRRGPAGVETLNREIERMLASADLLDPRGEHYPGRPIMLTRNDHELRLYNGDVGLIAHDEGVPPRPAVVFAAPEGGLRRLSPLRLSALETVFAMSVHKSQGSEFHTVALVLPTEVSPSITRELLYTAVSRARERAIVFSSRDVLRAGIAQRVERASGLREALWR